MTQSPVLVHYDMTKPIKLYCDASPHGVGTCLMHTVDGVEWLNKQHLVLYLGSNGLISVCMAKNLPWPMIIALFVHCLAHTWSTSISCCPHAIVGNDS